MKKYVTVEFDNATDVSGILPTAPASITVGSIAVSGKVFLVTMGPEPPAIPPDLSGHGHTTPSGQTGPPVMP